MSDLTFSNQMLMGVSPIVIPNLLKTMAFKNEEFDPQVIATTLMGVVQETFIKMCNLEFSDEPAFTERKLIEYDSRMRVFGLEKFNAPCYASSVSYYLSQKHIDSHNACGVLNLFLEEDVAVRILKALGCAIFNEEDDELVLDNCGEFCNVIAGNFKNELANIGYKDLYLSAPLKEKNNLSNGVEFPYSQYTYFETQFFLWKKKAVVIDIAMAPIGLK